MTDPLQALLAAGAVPTTSFPPTSRYAGDRRRRLRPAAPGEEPRRCRSCAAGSCPRPERFALLYEVRRASRATGATCSPPATSATPSCGGGWPTPTASIDPRELTEPVGRRLRVTLPEGVPGTSEVADAQPAPGAAAAAHRARRSRCRSPRRSCSTRCSEVTVESRVGRDAERLRAPSSTCSNRSPLHTLFLLTGGASHPDPARRHRGHASAATTTVLIDGVMTHHEVALRRRPDVDAAGQGQGPHGADGHHPARRAALSRRCRRRCACWSRSRSTPRFGVIPLVIPSVLEDIPIPIERIPRHQGTDYAYVQALAERGRLRLLHRPGPGARREQGLLGAGDPGRRRRSRRSTSASTARTTTSTIAALPLRQGAQGAAGRLHPGAGQQGADPDPDPGRHAAQPAARRWCRRCRRRSRSSRTPRS